MFDSVLTFVVYLYFLGFNFWYLLCSWNLLIPDYQLLEVFKREGLSTPGLSSMKFAYGASVIVEAVVYPAFDFCMLLDTSTFSVIGITRRVLYKIIFRTVITLTLRILYSEYLYRINHDKVIVDYAQQEGIVIPHIEYSRGWDRITGPYDLTTVAQLAIDDIDIESHTGIRTMMWPEPSLPINAPIMLFLAMVLYCPFVSWLTPLTIFVDWVSTTRNDSMLPVERKRCHWQCRNESHHDKCENCKHNCEECGHSLATRWEYTPCDGDYSCPSLTSVQNNPSVIDLMKEVWHQPNNKCITITTLYTFVWLNNVDWTDDNSYHVRANVEKLRLPHSCKALVYHTNYTMTKKGQTLLPCDLSVPLYYCTVDDIIQLDL